MCIVCSFGVNNGLIKLYEGRAPSKYNEIVLDKWVLEKIGCKKRVGQNILLNFDIVNSVTNKKYTKSINFKLVGINKDITVRKTANAGLMFVSNKFIKENSNKHKLSLHLLLNTNNDVEGISKELGLNTGLQSNQIKLNTAYIEAFKMDFSSYITAIVIVLVIIFIAAIVIFNIFYIYVFQKIRLFGILKAIGATKKQLRILINIEGLIIAFTGSFIGIIIGILLSLVSVPLLGDVSNIDSAMKVEFSPYIILGSFILGILMVVFSTSFPSKVASKISEIDAIRFNPSKLRIKKNSRNKLKDTLNIRTLASTSFMRNKKRTIITILSITLTGLLFLVIASVLNSMNVSNMTSSMIQGDYKLNCEKLLRFDDKKNVFDNTTLNKIKDINGIRKIYTEMYDQLIFNKEDFNKYSNQKNKSVGNKIIKTNFYGYNDSLLKIALNSIKDKSINVEDMKNNNYLIAISGKTTFERGSKIRLSRFNNKGINKTKEFIVIDSISSYITYKGDERDGGSFICHQNLFINNSLDTRIKQLSVSIKNDKNKVIKDELKQISADNKIEFMSFQEKFNEINKMKKTIETAAYVFITTLILISIFNLVNTTLTNIISRNREFGMIEAVGMSRNQLIVQLFLESLVTVIISLILIISIGIPIGYYVVEMYKKEAAFAEYVFPIVPILILSLSYICTQIVITMYIQKKLHTDSLIERIRYIE
ncbi:MAG: ABC transporter permease [Clostridiales bacterium]